MTNSERVVSRQRALFPLPAEVRPDWWIITRVAREMGWSGGFPYDRPADIFREHARLSSYGNGGKRLFDIGHLGAIGYREYDALEPFRWGGAPFADGRFPTPDGKARLVPVAQRTLDEPLSKFPLTLNTGRYRDQWHTMTRTGLSPRLSQHRREPLAELHPVDAEEHGLSDGDLVRLATPQGSSVYRAHLTDAQRKGEIFAPIHWTDQQSSGGRTGLLPRAVTDPHSGQPGFKATPARIEKLTFDWRALLLANAVPPQIPADYYTRVRVGHGWLVELAGNSDPRRLAKALLPAGERIEVADLARGTLRAAVLNGGRLAAALYVARSAALPDREWLIAQLASAQAASSVELLAGRPAAPAPQRGPVVCACSDVGLNTIVEAIGSQRLTSVEAVGQALSAGTNCGSCRPAIQRLIGQAKEAASA